MTHHHAATPAPTSTDRTARSCRRPPARGLWRTSGAGDMRSMCPRYETVVTRLFARCERTVKRIAPSGRCRYSEEPGPESGLAASVERAVREITETKSVRTKLNLEKVARQLAPDVEYNLLRIVREAVNNAVKHAEASQINVALRGTGDAIQITINDDGSGFSTEDAAAPGPGHYGIIGMKERASQIGATLDLVTQKGAGTTITLTLPAAASPARTLEFSK